MLVKDGSPKKNALGAKSLKYGRPAHGDILPLPSEATEVTPTSGSPPHVLTDVVSSSDESKASPVGSEEESVEALKADLNGNEIDKEFITAAVEGVPDLAVVYTEIEVEER